jgi:cytidine deaminase
MALSSKMAPIRVVAAENTHYALMPAESRQIMKSYCYGIETPHGLIVFTGDTGQRRFNKPCDRCRRLVSTFQDFNGVRRAVDALVA